jgi:hypothetical protein
MNFKGNLKVIVSASILFLIIYLFVAAIPLGQDIYFTPVWTRDISSPVTADSAAFKTDDIEQFSLGDYFGYFTHDGVILSSTETKNRVSVSASAWASYPQDAENTVISRPDGTPKMTVNEAGFIHLDETRTYLFIPGGDAVAQYNDTGAEIWKREHTSPITAFNSSSGGTVIGYADGMFTCLDSDGATRFSFYPGGSDQEVILGVALSADGNLAACVSGLDKQRFLLVSIDGDQYKIVKHSYLEGNLRRQAYLDFNTDGNFAFFEYSGGLGIVDCRERDITFIPFDGQISGVGECTGNNLFVALVRNVNDYTLAAIERPNHLVATTRFKATDAFLVPGGTSLYLGMDSRISKIDIRGLK